MDLNRPVTIPFLIISGDESWLTNEPCCHVKPSPKGIVGWLEAPRFGRHFTMSEFHQNWESWGEGGFLRIHFSIRLFKSASSPPPQEIELGAPWTSFACRMGRHVSMKYGCHANFPFLMDSGFWELENLYYVSTNDWLLQLTCSTERGLICIQVQFKWSQRI